MLEPRPRELALQLENDFAAERRGAAGPAPHMREVVGGDDGVADDADEDWRDNKDLMDAVAGYGVEEEGQCELRE